MAKQTLTSWGNISKSGVVTDQILDGKNNQLDIGNLNSYGDCCLPSEGISLTYKSQIISQTVFDYQTQNNIYLYGTPGKSNVTIGGAIASDTHGKDNDWGGSFYKNIKNITLNINGKEIKTNKDLDPEIFEATSGGYGLTGTISNAQLSNTDIPISNTYKTVIKTGIGIEELFESYDPLKGEFWVGWINLLNNKLQWVTNKSIPTNKKNKNFNNKSNKELNLSVPFIGNNTLNLLGTINNFYYLINKNLNLKNRMKNYYDTFYPLSLITDTRNISSQRKIVQIQFSIPIENQFALESLIFKLINKQKPLLCSIKKLADQKILNNLSFYQNGWTVAVDFPYEEFNINEVEKFYKELTKYSGKIYLAKDLTLDEKNFRNMYPESVEWEKTVKKIDPDNLYQSELSKRLGLKKW